MNYAVTITMSIVTPTLHSMDARLHKSSSNNNFSEGSDAIALMSRYRYGHHNSQHIFIDTDASFYTRKHLMALRLHFQEYNQYFAITAYIDAS